MIARRGRPPRIVVVGSTMVDLIAYADVLPEAGQTLEGREFQLGFGGKGANQAVMAARLGADVAFVNRVGDDLFGSMTRHNLADLGIDTRHVGTVEGTSTGVAPIWVEPTGANRIIVVPGANATMSAEVVRLELGELSRADCVVCQLEIPQDAVAEAFRFGRAWGCPTVLNPAPAAAIAAEVLALTDWLIPNESEFEALTGAAPDGTGMLEAAATLGLGLVVTLGERGAATVIDGQLKRMEAPGVDAVDTTGAGDAFVGGFAYALANGHDVAEAIRLGNACGALSVTRTGTQRSFPPRRAALALAAGEEAIAQFRLG